MLQLVAQGLTNMQIAQQLILSEKTVTNHLTHIFNKTTTENRAAATAWLKLPTSLAISLLEAT